MIAQGVLQGIQLIDQHIRYFAAYKQARQMERALGKLADYQKRLSEIQGEAIFQEALAQESILSAQAVVSKIEAQRATKIGKRRAQEVRQTGERIIGDVRAKAGASGIDVNQGSPILIEGEIAYQAERQALTEQYQGESIARALTYDAEQKMFAGRNIRAAGARERRFTLLTGDFAAAGTRLQQFAAKMRRNQMASEKSQQDLQNAMNMMSSFGTSASGPATFSSAPSGGGGASFGSGMSNNGSMIVGSSGMLGGGV
jgi:hypothetical protein